MMYQVVEDIEAPKDERFKVQHSPFGHIWSTDASFADQISAEIDMERRAAGLRVVARSESNE